MTESCEEFRSPKYGSFNVCSFLAFPSDGKKWVVRLPTIPLVHNAVQKLRSEITTLE